MKTYREFLEFVNKNYRSFIFLAVFYSLWLVYKYALAFDPQLLSFPGRMIGEATLRAYDINKRISVFYRSGVLFFFSISLFSFIAWRVSLFSQRIFKTTEVQILNYTSLAGITFYFFNLWTRSFDSSFELIYCIQKVAIAGFILKAIFLKDKPVPAVINASFYSIAFVCGVSVFFIIAEASVLSFQLFTKPDFLVAVFISVLLVLILTIIYIRNKNLAEAKTGLNRLAFILIPIACIPVLSFFKDEIYLILNRHEVYYFSPCKLYLFFLFCIAAIIFLRFKRDKKKSVITKNTDQLVALRYLPLLVVSLATYTFYNPFIDISNEMFEAGNRFLPLMEFQKFGVLPVFEKFNSHVLSELFFGGIYAFFNGLHGREMYIYEFMYQVFWAFMVYRIIYRLSRNAYIALFVILLFPLIDTLLFDYTIISLLALFLTDKVIREKASLRNYFLLIACLAFLLIWRVDIGYPAIIASCATLLVYMANSEQFRVSWKLFFKAAGLFAGLVFIGLFSIGAYRHINVFEKLWSGMNYLASAQTYGISSLGDINSIYKIQYFVFPLLMILFLGAMLVFFKKLNISKSQRFIYSTFLFLVVYYFVNFQRGLVRHSFAEGHDNALSAFLFFIFSASIFLFGQRRSKVFRLIVFVIAATFLLMNYKFPAVSEYKNLYSKTQDKIGKLSAIELRPNIVRCIDTANYEEKHFGEFKGLISSCLNDKQTFIDFSNLPMLYYFTGKISPSYFYQNPLTIHNEYLQKKFISELSGYDAPFIVFSNFPETWWDDVDGVPNTMRHYRLAEYFYKNYKPFVIVDNLCVWKRNDFEAANADGTVFSYNSEKDSAKTENHISTHILETKKRKYLFKVFFNTSAPEIKISTTNNSRMLRPDFINEIEHIAYYTLKDGGAEFSVDIENNNVKSVMITAHDFIPDFYSRYPQTDDLQLLPNIWATYDDSVSSEKLLKDLSSSPALLKENDIKYFNFDPAVDKTSGNTIFISLETENTEPQVIDLMYGSSKNGFKGAFKFKIPPGSGLRDFAVRVSSHYNWYDPSVDYVALISHANGDVTVKKLNLLKAE